MDSERLNLPDTCVYTLDLLGHELQFTQDPNSKHLGTTVWDASLVFAKYLEKNSRKGRFSPPKLKGKRVIELGAGCGVAGFGMAMLGCDVVTTDQKEVLPLLQRNVERNISRITQSHVSSDSFGSIEVAELDWGNKEHIRAVNPPYDYVIGTDVVYSEALLGPLLETICALSGPRTTIMVGYEIRSTSVHDQMLQMWKRSFDVKTIPKSKMDDTFHHPSIELYMMGLKSHAGGVGDANLGNDQLHETDVREDALTEQDNGARDESSGEKNKGDVKIMAGQDLSDWEVRRIGAMAARLLHDVKID